MEIYRILRLGFSGRGRRLFLAFVVRQGVRTNIGFGIGCAVAHISPHQVYDTHVSRLTNPSRWCGFWWWCSGPGGSSAWISGCNWQHNCRFSWIFFFFGLLFRRVVLSMHLPMGLKPLVVLSYLAVWASPAALCPWGTLQYLYLPMAWGRLLGVNFLSPFAEPPLSPYPLLSKLI